MQESKLIIKIPPLGPLPLFSRPPVAEKLLLNNYWRLEQIQTLKRTMISLRWT